jgi:hypothetical protein
MLKGLRELADLALGLCFDLFELIYMLQVPVIASSTQGPDKVKALQLTAFLCIAILIVWSATSHRSAIDSGQTSWLAIGVMSTLYLSFSAWLIHSFLQATGQYLARSDLKLDALSVVLTFNFLVILTVTALLELNYYLDRRKPFEIASWDGNNLYALLLILPVTIAASLTLANSLRYLRRNATPSLGNYFNITAFTMLNVLLADIFVYLMYVVLLES